MATRDQTPDSENRGDPVNATGGNSKSPTHGQSQAFRDASDKTTDNNVHQHVLPVGKTKRV